MPEVMADADLFVLPSFYDSLGIVLIEAMACGVPVVATRCGGPEDIVDDKVGRLAAVGSAESLAEAIDEVLNGYDQFDRTVLRKLKLPASSSRTTLANNTAPATSGNRCIMSAKLTATR